MRIAYIADAQCNHGAKWVNHFAKTHEVILLTTRSQSVFPLYAQSPGIKIYPILPDSFPVHRVGERKKTITAIRELFEKHKIELVHAMYAVPYALWGHLSKHPKLVVTTRGSDVLLDYRGFLNPKGLRQKLAYGKLRRLFENAMNSAAVVTSNSFSQRDVLKTIIRDHTKMHLIRTGVDTEQFAPETNAALPSTDEFVIFSNRAMAPLYNIDVIVRAFHRLVHAMPGKKFRLVTVDYYGNPTYLEQIRSLVQELGLNDSVSILPAQEPAALRELYRNVHLVVMIPDSDGTAVSGVEALLSARPLIIGNIRYDDDLYGPSVTWKVDRHDETAVYEKMREVIDADPSVIRAKTNIGLTAALNGADYRKEIKKVEDLYHALLNH